VKLVHWLVALPLAAALAAFAVQSWSDVTLGLWPLEERLTLPLFLVVLATLLLGFVAGALAAWINGGRWRREARRRQRRIETLEGELRAAQARQPRQPAAAGSLVQTPPRD
jgi:uncharacterized integral membrane protein